MVRCVPRPSWKWTNGAEVEFSSEKDAHACSWMAWRSVERRFIRLLIGISAGEIPSDFPVAARASQVLDLSRGLTMRAQMGAPRKTLLNDAEEAADLVLLPRRGKAAPEG